MKFFTYTSAFLALCSRLVVHGAHSQTTSASAAQISAGYHVIYSYSGTTPPDQLTELIKKGAIGGILLFGENVSPSLPSQVTQWQSVYRSSSAYAGSPLLIMTDQEGGQVRRLPGGPSLSEKEIGASANPVQAATSAGQQAASALRTYANNVNLAPVGGVYRQSGNFLDQYGRSYSNQSSITSECISAFIKSQQSNGDVLATAKHFPGLGSAKAGQDTDAKPVTINTSLDELRSIDEKPFQSAIQADVDLIMPSWALYPALDAKFPSGLSRKWVTDELRDRLGFEGVIITDAIEAGGLNAFGANDSHRSILAIQAGQDSILVGARNVEQGWQIVQDLAIASINGSINAQEWSQSTQRILSLRSKITI
ncbi:putative glycosyl hydrolase [Meira miltonrushii]|uniref:Putative glycosyl hydrolase n=1 Tax=Meira miltonrushii TaxID=1280837 RepID=A0A316VC04_9BASI|nr:putative glycosyl hydrolase [Meira miltonrushii]PWN35197.1 putative glycosyl hydrolase [Meira miltonrushii]